MMCSLIVPFLAISSLCMALADGTGLLTVPPNLEGEYIDSSSPDSLAESERWSTYKAPTFQGVFVPTMEADLSERLAFLTRHNVPTLAKSGGHEFSTTLETIQNGVMINMEKFNYHRINRDSTATIGSGADFNTMIDTLGNHDREANVGSCPCLGVVGATLGGGIGRLQGLRGLSSDALREARLVLWNGTIVKAFNKETPDLFWGLRGAGHNFGIVTELTFETYPATNGGLNYEAQMSFKPSSIGKVIDLVNTLMPLDSALAVVIDFSVTATAPESSFIVNLVYMGPEAKGKKFAKPFIDISTFASENCINGKRSSLYGMNVYRLNGTVLEIIQKDFSTLVKAHPSINGAAIIIETLALQAVEAQPDSYLDIEHALADGSVARAGDGVAQKWRAVLQDPSVSGYDTVGVYMNYAHGDEKPSLLYGTEKWRQNKLTALKNTYDPQGFFNAYHPIPSKLSGWA